jgi:hypothetical protein
MYENNFCHLVPTLIFDILYIFFMGHVKNVKNSDYFYRKS